MRIILRVYEGKKFNCDYRSIKFIFTKIRMLNMHPSNAVDLKRQNVLISSLKLVRCFCYSFYSEIFNSYFEISTPISEKQGPRFSLF